jgi:hypothetical protein
MWRKIFGCGYMWQMGQGDFMQPDGDVCTIPNSNIGPEATFDELQKYQNRMSALGIPTRVLDAWLKDPQFPINTAFTASQTAGDSARD